MLAGEAVLIERVSATNSLLTGNFTGNFVFRTRTPGRVSKKCPWFGRFELNSLFSGTGKFFDQRGNFRATKGKKLKYS
jgi:hypothetical protein